MDKINEDVIFATIHVFKGLEYPYIIIADNERNSFPTYYGACGFCDQGKNVNCIKQILRFDEKGYYDELSVFYVGFTRARKKVYFTLSNKRLNYSGEEKSTYGSCFLKLKGISYDNLHFIEKW